MFEKQSLVLKFRPMSGKIIVFFIIKHIKKPRLYCVLLKSTKEAVEHERSVRKTRDRVFSPSIYGPSAKGAGHKSQGKNEDP